MSVVLCIGTLKLRNSLYTPPTYVVKRFSVIEPLKSKISNILNVIVCGSATS